MNFLKSIGYACILVYVIILYVLMFSDAHLKLTPEEMLGTVIVGSIIAFAGVGIVYYEDRQQRAQY